MNKYSKKSETGFTIVELVIGMTLLGFIAIGIFGMFVALVNSSVAAKQMAVGSTLATNQMEYLKSLPYDSLAVQGGSIYSTNPLPATKTQTVDKVTYTIKTSISYVDDAYDGCTNYPNQSLKQIYCRNYPPPSGAPAVDTNPQDYKIAHVEVDNNFGEKRGEVDTQISSRVSETNSTTGALFISVVDDTGSPVSGAAVQVINNNQTPVINLSDSTDSNGVAIFYGLPPDTSGYHYQITASKTNYSTLTTIAPSGSLQPNYPNQNILTQQSSYLTMTIKPEGQYSLLAEATDTSGNPLANVKIYAKGGYKKYIDSANTQYYFDNVSPSDSRPTTDSSGIAAFSNLVPGQYIFCGDSGATSCANGGTTYYVAAALPYSGTNAFNPITVPTYDSSSPPATTFAYNGQSYLQKVRLILTTNPNFPRVSSLSPDNVSLSSGSVSNFSFQVNGINLPDGTTVQFIQGASTYTASCTGTGTQLNCTANLTGISTGNARLKITASGGTLDLPDSPLLGGLSVTP